MPSTCPRSSVRPRRLAPPPARTATSTDGASGVVIEGTDASIRDLVRPDVPYPVVMVLWSPRLKESADFVATIAAVAQRYAGRFQLVTVDVDANPAILQAFQVQAVPVSFAFLQGQPVPLFEGAQPEAQVTAVIDQVLALAAQHGVTGTVRRRRRRAARRATDDAAEEPPLPPLHQQAYDAIESGDLDAAAAAYREALTQSPADTDAKLGLAQVGLMQRTAGVDLPAARAAAAADPTDVDAQIVVADLDLLGGHVEDAFVRLIDTVRVTADADRNKAREHLVELFEVVGTTDERVVKARKSLMSASSDPALPDCQRARDARSSQPLARRAVRATVSRRRSHRVCEWLEWTRRCGSWAVGSVSRLASGGLRVRLMTTRASSRRLRISAPTCSGGRSPASTQRPHAGCPPPASGAEHHEVHRLGRREVEEVLERVAAARRR